MDEAHIRGEAENVSCIEEHHGPPAGATLGGGKGGVVGRGGVVAVGHGMDGPREEDDEQKAGDGEPCEGSQTAFHAVVARADGDGSEEGDVQGGDDVAQGAADHAGGVEDRQGAGAVVTGEVAHGSRGDGVEGTDAGRGDDLQDEELRERVDKADGGYADDGHEEADCAENACIEAIRSEGDDGLDETAGEGASAEDDRPLGMGHVGMAFEDGHQGDDDE